MMRCELRAAGDRLAVQKWAIAHTPEEARPWFRKLRGLRDEWLASGVPPSMLSELSMGMSGDFEVAIQEGATMVRVGTAIFGSRHGQR